jgi:hypothetical protein
MEIDAESCWGQVTEDNPSTSSIDLDELFKPKAAESDGLKLHPLSSKENASKEYVL